MSSAIRFIKKHSLLQAKDLLKAAPFDTTHFAVDDDGVYNVRKDDRGHAIFNRPNQEWWSLGRVYDCDLYDIRELNSLVEALELMRNIGENIHDYIDGELSNFWMHGLRYSQERIIQAFNLVKAYEVSQ